MAGKITINDSDREEWVENDEGLYDMMRSSHLGMARWVRENRALIDEVIRGVLGGEQPAHYLKYGG